MKLLLPTLCCACLSLPLAAGVPTETPPPSPDRWQFKMSVPGWMPGMQGETGVNGLVSDVNLDPGDIIRHYDFAFSSRAELSRGRFGILTDVLYTSLSDGIGTDTVLKKLDLTIDQTIAELALRWRLIEGPYGSLDLIGGVRYTNLYQRAVTQPNDERIGEAAEAIVDGLGEQIRARIEGAISDETFRNSLSDLVKSRVADGVASVAAGDARERTLVGAPLAGPRVLASNRELARIVDRRASALFRATRSLARSASEAEVAALQAATDEARSAARAKAASLRRTIDRKIADAREKLENEIEDHLHDALDARISRTDDWWDPFVGLSGRYNVNDWLYLTARGDVGGFGVGSEFAWHAEAAVGFQLTRNLFAELGYRAYGVDYDSDGLVYDVIMHGGQVTFGIAF